MQGFLNNFSASADIDVKLEESISVVVSEERVHPANAIRFLTQLEK